MTQYEKISPAIATQPPVQRGGESDEWVDLQAIFRVLRRRIGLVVLVIGATIAIALPSILDMKSYFSAQSRLLMKDSSNLNFLPTELLVDNKLNLATEVERLLSRELAVKVVEEFRLDLRSEFNPALREDGPAARLKDAIKSYLRPDDDMVVTAQEGPDAIIPEYLDRLSVFGDSSEVVSIGFVSEDPELAAAVPNTLLRLYLEERKQRFAQSIADATGWLDTRIAASRGQVEAAVAATEASRDRPDISTPELVGIRQSVASMNQRHAAIRQARSTALVNLSALKRKDAADRGAEFVESSVMEQLIRDRSSQRAALGNLLGRYGKNHRLVIAARADLDSVESRILGEVAAHRQRLEAELDSLDAEESLIAGQMEEALQLLAQVTDHEAELNRLQRAADAAQDILRDLEDQRRTIQLAAMLPYTEVEVLSPASLPLHSEGRGRSFYLFATMCGAIFVAMTVAFIWEMLDVSVRSHHQLQKNPRLASAGFVPALPRRTVRRLPSAWFRAPGNGFADAIRRIALTLEKTRQGTLPRSLAVVSALPGEGTTLLSVALAAQLSRAHHRVLLIDADLRQGGLHALFGVKASPGLSDYLTGKAAISDIVRTDEATAVRYVTCGSIDESATLDRRMLEDIMISTQADTDLVMFDSPPVLASVDAEVLADLSERSLLVIRWGRTGRDAVEAAASRLLQNTAEDVLTVINRVDLRRQALYGYRDGGIQASTFRRYHKSGRVSGTRQNG